MPKNSRNYSIKFPSKVIIEALNIFSTSGDSPGGLNSEDVKIINNDETSEDLTLDEFFEVYNDKVNYGGFRYGMGKDYPKALSDPEYYYFSFLYESNPEGGDTKIEIAVPNKDIILGIFNHFDNHYDANKSKTSASKQSMARENGEEIVHDTGQTSEEEIEQNLLTEDGNQLLTENGTPIALEDVPPPPPEGLTPENIYITVRSLADNPSSIDLLGYEDYAKALADFISSPKTGKPLTIGIDAKWGMGKTTLMEMIQKRLEPKPTYPKRRFLSPNTWIRRKKKPKFHTVWFNAWKHDQEETLWSALILETLTKIGEKYGFFKKVSFWIKLNWQRFNKRKFGEILTKYILSSLVLVLLIGAIIYLSLTIFWPKVTLDAFVDKVIAYPAQIGLLATFSALFKIYQETSKLITGPFNLKVNEYLKHPNYEEHIGFFVQLEKDFEKIVELVTEDGKKPLVIFIDDLDRCEPPNAAEIFEAINLLIGANHCVFVIGMDSQTVAGSIEAKYKDLEKYFDDPEDPGGLSLGHRFIEKIVQINFQIPKSETQTIEQFIERNLGIEKGIDETSTEREIQEVESLLESEQRAGELDIDKAADLIQNENPEISNEVLSEAKRNIFAKTFDDSPDVKTAINEASLYLEANPRKIKRFINLFRLKTLIANRRGLIASQDINLSILAKIVVIEMRWPNVLEGIISDPQFINSLLSASSFIKKKRNDIQGIGRGPEADNYKAIYDAYQTDISIRNYLDAEDLHTILELIPHDLDELLPYYQLAK